MVLAERGKEFSPMETTLNLFYELLEVQKQIRVGKDVGDEEVVDKHIRELALELSQFVVNAIVEKNPNKIEEVARAVAALKTFKPKANRHKQKILFQKYILDKHGDAWTIGRWAKELKWPQNDKDNGYPQLRRLLKELCAPLKPTRQIEES
jgi:hypothetical protein